MPLWGFLSKRQLARHPDVPGFHALWSCHAQLFRSCARSNWENGSSQAKLLLCPCSCGGESSLYTSLSVCFAESVRQFSCKDTEWVPTTFKDAFDLRVSWENSLAIKQLQALHAQRTALLFKRCHADQNFQKKERWLMLVENVLEVIAMKKNTKSSLKLWMQVLFPAFLMLEAKPLQLWWDSHTHEVVLYILAGGSIAVLYNIVHSLVIQRTSAVTTPVIGMIKVVAIIILSALILGERDVFSVRTSIQ